MLSCQFRRYRGASILIKYKHKGQIFNIISHCWNDFFFRYQCTNISVSVELHPSRPYLWRYTHLPEATTHGTFHILCPISSEILYSISSETFYMSNFTVLEEVTWSTFSSTVKLLFLYSCHSEMLDEHFSDMKLFRNVLNLESWTVALSYICRLQHMGSL